MARSAIQRIKCFFAACALLGTTVAIPHHTHADHTAQQPHVDAGHGGHDAILIQETDEQSGSGKIVFRPAPAILLSFTVHVHGTAVRRDADQDPPFHPPRRDAHPRAPPTAAL